MKKIFLFLIAIAGLGTFAEDIPLIIPTPKSMTNGSWDTLISAKDKPCAQIILQKNSTILKTAADEINKYVVKNGGAALPLAEKENPHLLNIYIASGFKSNPFVRGFDLNAVKIPENKLSGQSYVIIYDCKRKALLLAGNGDAGALYAAVTFCHLLKNSDNKVLAYRCRIDDYPDFNFRGDSSPGNILITRGYLYSPKLMQTDKSYESIVKDYIDLCLHLKLNIMAITPQNLLCDGKDYTDEFIRYAKDRAFIVNDSIYASFFKENGKKSNRKKFEEYLAKTGLKKSDFMEHDDRLFAWSNEELLREMVGTAAKGVNVYYHCPDTYDENWGKRGNKCREKFGNDRVKADAFVINTIYDELKKMNADYPEARLYAVIQPYSPLYLDTRYYKYADEYVEHYKRLNKMIPSDIPFCVRESGRDLIENRLKIMPERPIYLYHEIRKFGGGSSILAPAARTVRTFYFQDRKEDIYSLKAAPIYWETDTPLGAEYSWNTEAPGSGFLDIENYTEFDINGSVDKKFKEITLPRVLRFAWGKEAGDALYKAYTSGLNVEMTLEPFRTMMSFNRKSAFKKKALLEELSPEIFKKQEKAADETCKALLPLMKGTTPSNCEFLRPLATRLYKHAAAARILAPVYEHYFAAEKALKEKDPEKAEREIKLAALENKEAKAKFDEQARFAEKFPQEAASFLTSDLRTLNPLAVADKKIAEFKIPTKDELSRTSLSFGEISRLAERNIEACFTQTPPSIDGKLNDGCWTENKCGISDFVNYPFTGKFRLAYDQTFVKVCYDDKNIYFAIRCADCDFDSIRGKNLPHDSKLIFSNDIVEVFINAGKNNPYVAQFVTDASGSSFDSLSINEKGRTISYVNDWNPVWQKATSLDDGGWTAEIAVPFESLVKNPSGKITALPKAGDKWKIYFAREKRTLEPSGVKFIRDGMFTSSEGYPFLIFR